MSTTRRGQCQHCGRLIVIYSLGLCRRCRRAVGHEYRPLNNHDRERRAAEHRASRVEEYRRQIASGSPIIYRQKSDE